MKSQVLLLSGGVITTSCVFLGGGILVQSAEMHLETLIAAQKLTGNVEDGIVIGST